MKKTLKGYIENIVVYENATANTQFLRNEEYKFAKQAGKTLNVPIRTITVKSHFNVFLGRIEFTATAPTSFGEFLTYIFTDRKHRFKVYGSMVFLAFWYYGTYHQNCLWLGIFTHVAMWGLIAKGCWNNFNGKEF